MALRLTTPAAIVLSSFVIGAAIVGARFVPRYEIVGNSMIVARLNATTGGIETCSLVQTPYLPDSPPTFVCR